MRKRRAIRRRRGRALRGRIEFGRGIVPGESIHLTPGHVYAMGASSSPDLIKVLSVTDDRIRYKKFSKLGDQSERVIERWIGEDLISSGEKTFKTCYGVSPQKWVHASETERRELLRGRL